MTPVFPPIPRSVKSVLFCLMAALLAAAGVAGDAMARDITLGGHRQDLRQGLPDNEVAGKLPEDAVALPRVVASVQNHETGQWRRVLVDAYLQSSDRRALSKARDRVMDIAANARPQLQTVPAESLGEARSGMREAKDCIRLAAEQALGRDWPGNVFIRSLAVF
jgi:hypothetical protein